MLSQPILFPSLLPPKAQLLELRTNNYQLSDELRKNGVGEPRESYYMGVGLRDRGQGFTSEAWQEDPSAPCHCLRLRFPAFPTLELASLRQKVAYLDKEFSKAQKVPPFTHPSTCSFIPPTHLAHLSTQ